MGPRERYLHHAIQCDYGYPYCEMTLGAGVYYQVGYWYYQPRGFNKVYVDGEGGNDTANLYGSAANDTFWGNDNEAVLSDGTVDLNNGDRLTAATYYYKLLGFDDGDTVRVYGSTGTNYRKIINPIDYAWPFTTLGSIYDAGRLRSLDDSEMCSDPEPEGWNTKAQGNALGTKKRAECKS